MRTARTLLSALALAGSLAGCVLITDLNANDYSLAPAPSGGSEGGTCSVIGSSGGQFTSGNPTCNTCLADDCCLQAIACFAGGADGGMSECGLFVQCAAGCSAGASCTNGCASVYPGGITAAQSLISCAGSNCSTSSCTGL